MCTWKQKKWQKPSHTFTSGAQIVRVILPKLLRWRLYSWKCAFERALESLQGWTATPAKPLPVPPLCPRFSACAQKNKKDLLLPILRVRKFCQILQQWQEKYSHLLTVHHSIQWVYVYLFWAVHFLFIFLSSCFFPSFVNIWVETFRCCYNIFLLLILSLFC